MSENTERRKKLFLVDTISTVRLRYAIEAYSLSHAYDEVTMRDSGNPADEFEQFTQKHISENIIDGKEISKEDFDYLLKTLEHDNSEICSTWLGDRLIRKINYNE